MSANQVGWLIALGFILIMTVIAGTGRMIASKTGQRIISEWHQERIAAKRIRLRAELTRKGVDPEYIKQLEKEAKR